MKLILSVLFLLISYSKAYNQVTPGNSIEILSDTSNQYACFKITRIKEKTYALRFVNDKNKLIFATKIRASPNPLNVYLPWANQEPGAYRAILKHKREEVILLFLKKEDSLPINITETTR